MGIVKKARPLLWGSAGAAVAYLCDADRGRGRRARIKDQAGAALRRGSRTLGRKTRYLAGKTQSVTAPVERSGQEVLEDQVVRDKVRSEVLGTPEFRDLDVLVEVANCVVTLRGEVADDDQMRNLERAISAVRGVERVENLLHAPGTPAPNLTPNKEAAREVS